MVLHGLLGGTHTIIPFSITDTRDSNSVLIYIDLCSFPSFPLSLCPSFPPSLFPSSLILVPLLDWIEDVPRSEKKYHQRDEGLKNQRSVLSKNLVNEAYRTSLLLTRRSSSSSSSSPSSLDEFGGGAGGGHHHHHHPGGPSSRSSRSSYSSSHAYHIQGPEGPAVEGTQRDERTLQVQY